MLKKLALGIVCVGLSTVTLHAAAPASDNAGNYADTAAWITGSNGGTGFGAWTITDGNGSHYIGGTGLGARTFGLFNTLTDPQITTEAVRPMTGTLLAGETFSIDLGFTAFSSGSIGVNLRSGTEEVITLFTNGTGDWMLNDGGGNFSAGSVATANTPYTFTFTYNGTNSYSFSLTGGPGGPNFTSSDPLIGSIDNIRLFNFNQGAGQNFGFDNIAIVPEPSSVALLVGPALLGAWFFVRRRRA